MAITRLRTVDLPAEHRFSTWHEMTSAATVPLAIDSHHREDFRATVEALDLGLMQLSRLSYPALHGRRTDRLIRQSDPELVLVSHVTRGRMVTQYARHDVRSDRQSLLVHNSSLPATVINDVPVTNTVLQLPRAALGAHADRIVGRPITTAHGIGTVLAFVLSDLARHGARHPPTVVAQLTMTTLDLLVAASRTAVGARVALPPESRSRIRQAQIHAYIRGRLGDPALTPGAIADAHGLSPRQLNRIFHGEGSTPSAWIRRERLEQCRRELVDPDLAARPVIAIGARWGFPDPVTFNRAFRREFGMPPGEYRRRFAPTIDGD